MKNKTWRYWVVASIVLLLVGCGGGAKNKLMRKQVWIVQLWHVTV